MYQSDPFAYDFEAALTTSLLSNRTREVEEAESADRGFWRVRTPRASRARLLQAARSSAGQCATTFARPSSSGLAVCLLAPI